MNGERVVALLGNPNVGKSTVFNELTGLTQHTGNWTGKTVDLAEGKYYYKFNNYTVVDLPGTYSLLSNSPEEKIARDFVCFNNVDCVVCICDAGCLKRNLNLVLQALEMCNNVVVVLNLMDEAKKKNISINTGRLSEILGVPVVESTARSGKGINHLLEEIHSVVTSTKSILPYKMVYPSPIEQSVSILSKAISLEKFDVIDERFMALRLLEEADEFNCSFCENLEFDPFESMVFENAFRKAKNNLERFNMSGDNYRKMITSSIMSKVRHITAETVKELPSKQKESQAFLDRIMLGKWTALPAMLIMLGIVLWLTITGSNYPSALLSDFMNFLENKFDLWFNALGMPLFITNMLVHGVFRVLGWVVAVMLPPMAIFFPLFALLEDYGILPRIAFNLDCGFEKCGACGKQALTTCMGFGCNAVGVTGARIIDSPRERIIAILTNSFVPCNGRFPLLIAIIAMFFASSSALSALILLGFMCISIGASMLSSKILSKTVLKGMNSSFILELPPYRKPQFFKVIIRAIKERILFVLGRAVSIAAPAGLVIWLFANLKIGDSSILQFVADKLDPIGQFLGLDGVLLLAFILGFPANEIVLPIALMTYLSTSVITDYSSLDSLRLILVDNGWTATTAICTCIFSMFHFPCSTTMLTIWKETKSVKWTALSFFAPLIVGIICCAVISHIF